MEKVEYSLKDRAGGELKSGTITGFVADSPDPVELTLDETVEKVASAEFKIIHDGEKVSRNVGLGFREVGGLRHHGGRGAPEPSVKITPELGGSMVEGGLGEKYFDDRLWNRTYDDYQDLYGYYGVKRAWTPEQIRLCPYVCLQSRSAEGAVPLWHQWRKPVVRQRCGDHRSLPSG